MTKFKTAILLTVLSIFLMVSLFGCYGNFALTRKLYTWNGSLGDKYVNNLVFWVLMFIPAYSAAGFIDFVVLNTVEFWTGSNPMAMNEGEQVIKYAQNKDHSYKVTFTQNNILIEEVAGKNAGQQVQLSFDPDSQSWFLVDNGSSVKVATVAGNQMNLFYPSGNSMTVNLAD